MEKNVSVGNCITTSTLMVKFFGKAVDLTVWKLYNFFYHSDFM